MGGQRLGDSYLQVFIQSVRIFRNRFSAPSIRQTNIPLTQRGTVCRQNRYEDASLIFSSVIDRRLN